MSIMRRIAALVCAGLFISHSLYGATLSISISANPAALTINTATAGSQPNNATNTSTTYSCTTSTSVVTITGALNSNMPTNVTLAVQLAAPTGATSAGLVTMKTTAATLVSAIPKNTTGTALTITYHLSATVSAAQATNATRTLTLTI